MDNSSKNTKNHPNLESCGKIRENGLFSGEFADKKRKWKSKSCSEDLASGLPSIVHVHLHQRYSQLCFLEDFLIVFKELLII